MKTRQTNSENGMTLSSDYCVAKLLVHDHYTEIPGENCNLHIFLVSKCVWWIQILFRPPLFFQTNIEKGEGSFLASKSILEDALSFHLEFLTDIKVKVCMILKGSGKKRSFLYVVLDFFVEKCVIEVATYYLTKSYCVFFLPRNWFSRFQMLWM